MKKTKKKLTAALTLGLAGCSTSLEGKANSTEWSAPVNTPTPVYASANPGKSKTSRSKKGLFDKVKLTTKAAGFYDVNGKDPVARTEAIVSGLPGEGRIHALYQRQGKKEVSRVLVEATPMKVGPVRLGVAALQTYKPAKSFDIGIVAKSKFDISGVKVSPTLR